MEKTDKLSKLNQPDGILYIGEKELRLLLLSILNGIVLSALAFASYASSSGTAFSVANGHLLTNHHVIEGCESIELVSGDGKWPVTVIDSIAQIDLALLRVYGLRGPVAKFRKPGSIKLGESIYVFGFPLTGALSTTGNFTSGTVSSLRGFKDAAGEIQITAPIQPGNSGGPVMDTSGYIVGVVSSKLDAMKVARTIGDVPQNVNFAISLDVVADFLEKNKLAIQEHDKSEAIAPEDIAAAGQGFTYRVQCTAKQSSTKSPPPKPPLTQAGPLNAQRLIQRQHGITVLVATSLMKVTFMSACTKTVAETALEPTQHQRVSSLLVRLSMALSPDKAR